MGKQRYNKPYMQIITAVGIVVCLFSAYYLPVERLDWGFLILAFVTVGVGSRIGVQISPVKVQITVSDTFVFLTMLLYDGHAAVLLATAEALYSSFRFSKKPLTIAFNAALLGCSTFLTVWVLHFCFGPVVKLTLGGYSADYIQAVCLMAFTQYFANSGLAAIRETFKTGQAFWATWRKYYLWTSITYLAGAWGASIIATFYGKANFTAFLIALPVIVIVYLTYHTYRQNIEASEAQAEQAERHVEELSRYLAEQERIREQFSQIEKLSAIGELASGVAHDFNNTLATILARAQLLSHQTADPKIKRGLEIIITSAKDGANTVKRIQDFARQRRDHDFAPVAIDQVLFDVSEITRPRWKDSAQAANIHINLELQNHSNALIMGDASELREILVNMVFNAVEAMPEGGELKLSAEQVGDSVEICVSDTGVGMSPEVRSRIFDPFFTTKGTAGMGLGLAVGYGIIRRHEGTIDVTSELGRGTTFRIKLPIAKEVAEPQPENDFSAPVIALPIDSKRRFLVVDDEDYVRELLCEILESENCEVAAASGGLEALELFDAGKFDAVFTDVGMPGMSGWEFARAIRERNSQIPIAVITGWGEAVGSSEQAEAQVNWVVTKPFDMNRIIEILREVSRHRHEAQESAALTIAA